MSQAEWDFFRAAGEAPLDIWMLAHPYIVMGVPLALCLLLSAYVLWATDPLSILRVRVCSHHLGGDAVMGWRQPWGHLLLRALEWAERRVRLPVIFSHGICELCLQQLTNSPRLGYRRS